MSSQETSLSPIKAETEMPAEASKKPKVLRIISRLNVGGPAVHCTLLNQFLPQKGFESVLLTGFPGEGEEDYESLFRAEYDGHDQTIIRISGLKRALGPFDDLRAFCQIVSCIRKHRPTIVHTHTAKAGVLGRIAARLCGVPIVIHTFHGHVLHGYFSNLMSKAVRFVERQLARLSTKLVTLSPRLVGEIQGQYKVGRAEQFEIVPLGRDLSRLYDCHKERGKLREELGIDPEQKLLGIVGRLVPIKDHQNLFHAFKELKDSGQSAALVVVGDGPLRLELEELARQLEIDSDLYFLGWRNDLARIYSDCDLIVFSSINEGTPLAMIEAFAASKPVVSTAVGGIPDMLELKAAASGSRDDGIREYRQGLLVPSENSKLLAEAMTRLLSDDALLQECGLAARELASSYDAETLIGRMASLYHKLIEDSE